jgi:hypothetical protein
MEGKGICLFSGKVAIRETLQEWTVCGLTGEKLFL